MVPSAVRAKPLSFDHEWVVHQRSTPAQAIERATHADILVVNKVCVDERLLAQAHRLKFVAVAATGTDNVDLSACEARGVSVSHVQGYAQVTLPEHTFALIFALRRSLFAYRDSVIQGRWQASGQFCYFDFPIRDLNGATLGIVGDGALGRAVGHLGAALGMKVLYAERKHARVVRDGKTSFDDVLRLSDVISLHAPLTPQTRHLIGAAEFAAMKRAPLLINTARAGLVDEEALFDAMQDGSLSGAGFDVAQPEPPPPDSPLMRLLARPDFILTPHVAWASESALQSLAAQVVENIEYWAAGTPRRLVTTGGNKT
nr:D-2-hydroxyacid dehydrogenase [Pandoraea sp.]